jgi:Cyclin, C-terminal domain
MELLDYELLILKTLNLSLNLPLPLRFYLRYSRAAGFQPDSLDHHFGLFLLTLTLMYPSIHFSYPGSLIAASIVHVVLRIRESKWGTWSEYLRDVTGYTESELRECSYRVVRKYVGLVVKKGKYEERGWVVERRYRGEAHKGAALVRPRVFVEE